LKDTSIDKNQQVSINNPQDRHTGLWSSPGHNKPWPGQAPLMRLEMFGGYSFSPGESGASLSISTWNMYAGGDYSNHVIDTKIIGGKLTNGSVSVSVNNTGSSETAPKHMLMRYFIRARH